MTKVQRHSGLLPERLAGPIKSRTTDARKAASDSPDGTGWSMSADGGAPARPSRSRKNSPWVFMCLKKNYRCSIFSEPFRRRHVDRVPGGSPRLPNPPDRLAMWPQLDAGAFFSPAQRRPAPHHGVRRARRQAGNPPMRRPRSSRLARGAAPQHQETSWQRSPRSSAGVPGAKKAISENFTTVCWERGSRQRC